MAKILVVARELNEATWSFTKALRNQGHTLVILTSKGTLSETSDPHIQVHFYFKKWTFLESLQYVPFLFKENFEIVHFYIEDEDFGFAQVGLLAILNWDPSLLISTSVMNLNLELKRFSSLRWLLERSDLVTTSTLEMMAALRGLNIRNRQQTRGLLPPFLDLSTKTSQHKKESSPLLDSSLLKNKPFLVIPVDTVLSLEKGYLQELSELATRIHLVFCFVQSEIPLHQKKRLEALLNHHIGSRWAFSFNSNEERFITLASKSNGILLAGQNFKPLEFSKWVRWSFVARVAPLIDDEQSKMYSALWEDQINCKIFRRYHLQKDYHLWARSLVQFKKIDLGQSLSQKKEIMDAPVNQLQRLYNKALSRKSFVS